MPSTLYLCSLVKLHCTATLGTGAVATVGDVFASALPKGVAGDVATSSLLLVRAHAVKAGALGRIVDQVLGSGFEVVNAKMTMPGRLRELVERPTG